MIVRSEFFGHTVGDGNADGQAVVSQHLAKAIKCRRFHLKVAHTPALVVEGFDFAVVLGVGEAHPQRAALWTVKTWCRGGNTLLVAFCQALKEGLGSFYDIGEGQVFRVDNLLNEGVAHFDVVHFLVFLVEIQQAVQA